MPFMNRTQTVTTQFAKHFSFRFGSHKTGKLSFLPMVSHASKGTRKVTTMYFMLSCGVLASRIKVFIYTLNDKSKHWELISDECPLVKTRDDGEEINRHMVEFDSNNHGCGDLPWFRLDVKMDNIQETIFYFGKVNHGNRFVRSKKYLTTLLGKDTILDDSLTMDKIHQKFLSFTTQDSSVSTIMDDHGPSPSPSPQSPPLLNLPTYVPYNPFAAPMYYYPQTAFGYHHSMDVMMGQHAHLLNTVQSMNQTQTMYWIDPTTQGSTIGTNSVNFAMDPAVDQHQSTPATSIDSTDNFWDPDSVFQFEPNNFPTVVDVSHEPERRVPLSHTGDDQSIAQKRKLSCFAEEEDDLFPPAKFMTFDDEEEPALDLFDFEGHKL